jgi:hypothetical protein
MRKALEYVGITILALGIVLACIGFVFQSGSATIHAATSPGIPWTCSVDDLGATLTLCKDGVPPGYKLYITDLVAQSTTSTGGLMLLRYGTGTNCGTGTTSVLPSAATVPRINYSSNALPPTHLTFTVPVSVPAQKDLCIIGTATNTLSAQIMGEIRP